MRASVGLLVIAAAVGAARAEDPPQPRPPTAAEAADSVVAAVEAQDVAALGKLAAAGEPDRWHVVHLLCVREAYGPASDFAGAVRDESLAAYVRSRREAQGDALAAIRSATESLDAEPARPRPEPPEALKDGYLRARLYLARAATLKKSGEVEKAAAAYHAAGAAAAAVGWLAGAVTGYAQAGYANLGKGRFREARQDWVPLIGIHRLRGDPVAVATISRNVANLTYELRELDQAVRRCDQAIAAYERVTDTQAPDRHTWIAYMRSVRARARSEFGEYPQALSDLEDALAAHEKAGIKPLIAATETFLGAVYQRLGDFEEALRHHERALALYVEMKDEHGMAVAHANIGAVSERSGDVERAADELEQARVLYERLGRKSSLVRMRHALARVAWKSGRREQAAEELASLLPRIEGTVRVAVAEATLGEWLVRLGRLDEAEAVLERCLMRATEADLQREMFEAQVALTRLAAARGDAAGTADRADAALLTLRALSASLSFERTARARAKRALIFDLAIAAAADLGDVDRVSGFVERSRSGALSAAIAGSGSAPGSELADALRNAQRAEAAAGAAHRRALGAGGIAEVQRTQVAYGDARERLRKLTQRVERDRRLALSSGFVVPVSGEGIAALLSDGDALVRYALLEQGSIALVSEKIGGAVTTRLVRLGPASTIRGLCDVTSYRADEGDWEASATRLRAAVIEPLGLASTVRRLIVCPDGALCRVPFALLSPRESVCVPSATVLSLVAPRRASKGERVLALGDPEYAGDADLSPLPFTRTEVQAVGDVTLVGGAASEAGFVAALAKEGRWRAVHLACHGLLDERAPMRTALALTPTADADGMLTVLDVLRLRVDADLAVLSACDTGRGRLVDGEGVVGLTQAFLAAGAPRVIVSLWMVDDAATATLMKAFYATWRGGGSSASAALRKAREHVRGHDKWKHPRFWAGWTLWGVPD